MSGRHEAPWVPDTTPGYQGQHRQSVLIERYEAMRGLRLCGQCESEHFRAYPEQPDRVCQVRRCQCWCRS